MTLKSPISGVEWYFLHEFAEKSTLVDSATSIEKVFPPHHIRNHGSSIWSPQHTSHSFYCIETVFDPFRQTY